MSEPEPDAKSRRISLELPNEHINHIDQLMREWGLRARGDVLKRLLDEVLPESDIDLTNIITDKEINKKDSFITKSSKYNENKALVLITKSDTKSSQKDSEYPSESSEIPKLNLANNSIDLPTFVSKRTKVLKTSLRDIQRNTHLNDNLLNTVSSLHLQHALEASTKHWLSLYGNKPKENVVEAGMIWLARDIWPNLDNTDGITFTWTAANRLVKEYCKDWKEAEPTP